MADTLRALYKSLVRPLIEYADVVWNGCSDSEGDLLDFVQYEEGKIVTVAMKRTSRQRLMSELGREELNTKRAVHKLTLYFKIVNNLAPHYLKTSYLPALARELTFRHGILVTSQYFPYELLDLLILSFPQPQNCGMRQTALPNQLISRSFPAAEIF